AGLALGPVLRHPRYYASGPAATASDVRAVGAGLVAAAAIVQAAAPPGRGRVRLIGGARSTVLGGVAVAAAIAAGLCMIIAAPAPRIDVWHLLQVSSRGLVDGRDMYRQQWAPSAAAHQAAGGGLLDVYPYLPGSSVLLAPFRLLFGDVRYGLLAASTAAAVAVRRLSLTGPGARAGAGVAAVGAPLLVLLFPESTYALQQSWTEPLLVAALAGMVWAVRTGRTRLAVFALAAALASKQHIVLVLPVAAAWPAFGPRRTAAATGLAAAFVAPWVIAGPRDFWHDAVVTNLNYRVLDDSLSIPGWLHHFGLNPGFGLTAVALALAYRLAWRARGTATGFAGGSGLVIVALDLTNKQTFFNHYTLAMGLVAIALAAHGSAPSSGDVTASAVDVATDAPATGAEVGASVGGPAGREPGGALRPPVPGPRESPTPPPARPAPTPRPGPGPA
ncbi:MAG: glycosyltransferase 87 family protein, partial [Frankia sp.]